MLEWEVVNSFQVELWQGVSHVMLSRQFNVCTDGVIREMNIRMLGKFEYCEC